VSLQFVDLEPGDPRLEREVLPVLAELRIELTAEQFAGVYAEGQPQGLRFTAAYDSEGRCVGVAGWRLVATTAALRKLYVDDLVVASGSRSSGVGSALLSELTARARRAGCSFIDLDSALHRSDAHRFYIREGLPIVSFHFGRALG
jgi:GNAT superfamily N-acetyltransferase